MRRSGRKRQVHFYISEMRKRQPASPAHIVCIEVKLAENWDRKWEQPMRSLLGHRQIHVDKMIGVYTGKRRYHFDGVDAMPVGEFLTRLYEGAIF